MTRPEILDTAKKCVCGDREQEEWRYIPGYSKDYMASNLGRIKSVKRTIVRNNGWPQTIKERILKSACDEWGYPQVRIDGKTIKVHRAIALAFLGERLSGEEIRHLDGNPANSKLSNLSYGTHSENILDGYTYRGNIGKHQKLSVQSASAIKTDILSGKSSRKIAREYGISEQSVCDIKHGRTYAWLEVTA